MKQFCKEFSKEGDACLTIPLKRHLTDCKVCQFRKWPCKPQRCDRSWWFTVFHDGSQGHGLEASLVLLVWPFNKLFLQEKEDDMDLESRRSSKCWLIPQIKWAHFWPWSKRWSWCKGPRHVIEHPANNTSAAYVLCSIPDGPLAPGLPASGMLRSLAYNAGRFGKGPSRLHKYGYQLLRSISWWNSTNQEVLEIW